MFDNETVGLLYSYGIHRVLVFQIILFAIAILLIPVFRRMAGQVRPLELRFRQIGRHRAACIAICFALPLLLRLALLPAWKVPIPFINDEYSYLLGGDTFAKGRLTNPTHPYWEHFETIHENMQPTYQSMYPPGQALFLAGGEVVTGTPWFGIWFSVGAMCAAVCWALQGYLPGRWAFLGGLFTALRFGLIGYWMNSYFGGAVAALGGALALGAVPRIIRYRRLRDAVWFSLGLALLANTRMLEGFAFSLPLLAALAIWIVLHRRDGAAWLRVALPVAAMGISIVAAMAYYNYRSTGSATTMPYVLNMRTYHIAPPFIGQKLLPEPNKAPEQMRVLFEELELNNWKLSRSAYGIWRLTYWKFFEYQKFYFFPCVVLLLLGVRVVRSRWPRPLLVASGVMTILAACATIYQPEAHYLAPMWTSVTGVTLFGFRYLRTMGRKNGQWGLHLSRSFAALAVILWVAVVFAVLTYRLPEFAATWKQNREMINEMVTDGKTKALIFVKYEGAWASNEWVYNAADIDQSAIIWARSLGPQKDRKLLDYYAPQHRKLWLVKIGATWVSIEPLKGTP
jgi:hypothetical protein